MEDVERRGPDVVADTRGDEGLVIVDALGRVRIVDHRARELLGHLLDVGDVLPPLVLGVGTVGLEELRDGRASDVELRIVPARLDREDGWAITVAEVSSRRRREDLVLDRLAVVAHELRTPLAAIIGYADVLLGDLGGDEGVDEDHRRRFLGTILQQGLRLDRMVTDLTVLTTADHGLATHPVPLALDRAVDDALAVLGGEDEVTRDGEQDVVVLADPGHVERIVLNLVTNAVKYGRPPVTVSVAREDDGGVIRVRDHGDGVPDGFRTRMWDAFERSRESGDSVPGSGLGLAVVATLAAVNGGRTWYEECEPNGACFVVAMPLAGEGPQRHARRAAASGSSSPSRT